MKSNIFPILSCFLLFTSFELLALQDEPENKLDTDFPLSITYAKSLTNVYNLLSEPEQKMVAILHNALLPLNFLAMQQMHRLNTQVWDLLLKVLNEREIIEQKVLDQQLIFGFDYKQFFTDLENYLTFFAIHHGPYPAREHRSPNGKYTPEKLNIKSLNEENLKVILNILNISDQLSEELENFIFNKNFEPCLRASNTQDDILNSAVNIYGPGFSSEHYQQVIANSDSTKNERLRYFRMVGNEPKEFFHTTSDLESGQALSEMNFWFHHAHELAQQEPDFFDEHFCESLTHLAAFNESAAQEDFENYLAALVQSNSRITFYAGIIFRVTDPVGKSGFPAGTLVVNSMGKKQERSLQKLFKNIEADLPFADKYKRFSKNTDSEQSLPNFVLGHKFFGVGRFGPEFLSSGFDISDDCLFKKNLSKKQIMFLEEAVADRKILALKRELSMSPENSDWLNEKDPFGELFITLRKVLTLCHEVLGHGSGKFAKGINETIAREKMGNDYKILEEIRAEILGLYVSLKYFDQLKEQGLFDHWTDTITDYELKYWLTYVMISQGLTGLIHVPKNASTIGNPYTLASQIVIRALVNHDVLSLDYFVKDSKQFIWAVDVSRLNANLAFIALHDLVIKIQKLKSTANAEGTRKFLNTHNQIGNLTRRGMNIALQASTQRKHHEWLKKIIPLTTSKAHIFPHFQVEIIENDAQISSAFWPDNLLEGFKFPWRN